MRVALIAAAAALSVGQAHAGYWEEPAPSSWPIESVVDRIVPVGPDHCWKIRIGESLRGEPVAYTPANGGWESDLRAMASQNGMAVEINRLACTVTILRPEPTPAAAEMVARSAPALPMPAPAPAPALAPAPVSAEPKALAATTVAPMGAAEPVSGEPAELQAEAYFLRKGPSLRDQVDDWAQRAGWSLVWELPYDYRVVVDAGFHGPIFDAVATLVKSYERAGEMRDVEWVFNDGNKVIVVRPVDRFIKADRVARNAK